MSLIHLEVVTAERTVLSEDVSGVFAPTVNGQISVLPGHVPLVTMLQPGELVVRTHEGEHYLAISGGFLEVTRGAVVVLANASEREEEIDVDRAQQAKARAKELMRSGVPDVDLATAEASLRRAMARLHVAERRRRRRGRISHESQG